MERERERERDRDEHDHNYYVSLLEPPSLSLSLSPYLIFSLPVR